MMDVTFVLEESGVTATVEVPCEADVAAAKEVACTALAVSPASVEMRIGTQVLEGTCRLQDTAFDAGVQVVLARRFANIKCPAAHSVEGMLICWSLSRCGTLCVLYDECNRSMYGLDTETFESTFFVDDIGVCAYGAPAISACKKRCYLTCKESICEVALPGGEVVRNVNGISESVSACGSVVVSHGKDCVSVYDKDLTLLRTLTHKGCVRFRVSDCGGWVITSSKVEDKARLWDVNTGEAVACVSTGGTYEVALSRSASVFAVGHSPHVRLYDWSGAFLRSVFTDREVGHMEFTPCGKYLVVGVYMKFPDDDRLLQCDDPHELRQYDVATMSCVHVILSVDNSLFAISPCSRTVVFQFGSVLRTRYLYPHSSD